MVILQTCRYTQLLTAWGIHHKKYKYTVFYTEDYGLSVNTHANRSTPAGGPAGRQVAGWQTGRQEERLIKDFRLKSPRVRGVAVNASLPSSNAEYGGHVRFCLGRSFLAGFCTGSSNSRNGNTRNFCCCGYGCFLLHSLSFSLSLPRLLSTYERVILQSAK